MTDRHSSTSEEPPSQKDRKPSSGIFGQWLRRRDATSPARPANVATRAEAAATAQEQDTPTWSEGSGTSDFAHLDTQNSPSIPTSASAESVTNTSMADQQSSAKLAGRLGGWLSGMSNAAGVVLGGAVRGGTKALQKMTAQERLQDLHAATEDLETTAADLRGEGRVRTLKHWCLLLTQLQPDNLPVHHHYTLSPRPPSPTPPGSPQVGRAEGDWQQLNVAKLDTAPTKLPVTVPTHALSRPQQPAQAKSGLSEGTAHTHGHERNKAGVEGDFWANQVLYVGQEPGQQEHDLLTFRELFLHSYALENIIVGYLDTPPTSPSERKLLIELFGLCLTGDAAVHTRLVDALLDLSAVEAECRGAGTAASLGPQQPPLANIVAETICGIKIQAESEVLARKMAALQGDIAEQAAEVHRCNKFNSGATEPSAGSSPTKLTSGLAGTAQIMHMSSKLHRLSSRRAEQVGARVQPQYEAYLGLAKGHSQALESAVAILESKAGVANKRKADGEVFRDQKLEEMSSALQSMDQQIGALDGQQTELLRQLGLVQQQISAAQAKRADLEEGRHVFQEGNAFTLEALQHQVDELATHQRHHLAENAALAECQTLIQEAASAWGSSSEASQASCKAVERQARQDYMHAATRHLYYQRALLQLLLRQLTFCVSELQGVEAKEDNLKRMGMEGIISDLRASKQRLRAKLCEAHSSAQRHLADVAAVRAAVDQACTPSQPTPVPSHMPARVRNSGDPTDCSQADQLPAAEPADLPHPLAEAPVTDAIAQQQPGSAIEEASQPQQPADPPAVESAVAIVKQDSGPSEELLDLFASIDLLRQEVAALPDPNTLSPIPGQDEEGVDDDQTELERVQSTNEAAAESPAGETTQAQLGQPSSDMAASSHQDTPLLEPSESDPDMSSATQFVSA